MDFRNSQHWNELAGSFAAFWIYGTVVQALPTPRQDERWYGWLYTVLNAIAANWATLKAGKMPPPQDPPKA